MTLNATVEQMARIALSHKQIKHVYFADILEWLANGDVQYPALFFDITGAKIDKTQKQRVMSFDVWLCDLVNVSGNARGNELEVLSDLTSVAEDYVALLKDPAFDDDWTVDDSYPLEYFREKFDDVVGAVKMSVVIGANYVEDRCQVPLSGSGSAGVLLTEKNEFILQEDGKQIKLG